MPVQVSGHRGLDAVHHHFADELPGDNRLGKRILP